MEKNLANHVCHKELYPGYIKNNPRNQTCIHGKLIHKCSQHHCNNPKAETNQVPFNWWMNTQKVVIHLREYYSPLKKNEVLIRIATWMNPENITLHERVSHEKQHSVRFHLYEMLSKADLLCKKVFLIVAWVPGWNRRLNAREHEEIF